MKKCFFVFFLLIVLLYSCNQGNMDYIEPIEEKNGTSFDCFELTIPSEGKVYKPFLIQEGIIHIIVSNGIDLSCVKPKFVHKGVGVYLDNIEQFSNENIVDLSDFTNPVEYEIRNSSGESKKWKIVIYDLPVLKIDTPDEVSIESKETRVEGCNISLVTETGIEEYSTAGIKVRGNSTSHFEKKPYNVKFDTKQSFFNLPKSKKWVLLSNPHYDRTQLHNAVAFQIARLTDYPWVQSGDFVELMLNGKHVGLYYLCEKIDIEKDRINIKEIKDSDLKEPAITGGYLLEADILYEQDKNSFQTEYFNKTGSRFQYSYGWILKNPDGEVPSDQLCYIRDKLNDMERRIYDEELLKTDEYLNYFDIETAINWLLVEDLCLNEEASRSKNLLMYKNRGDDKFYIAPPWDFDAWTFGIRDIDSVYAKTSGLYFYKLFNNDTFVKRVKEKWNLYKPIWEEQIPAYMDYLYNKVKRSAKRNELMWPNWHTVNCYPEKSYDQLYEEMKQSFFRQLEYMNNEIRKL